MNDLNESDFRWTLVVTKNDTHLEPKSLRVIKLNRESMLNNESLMDFQRNFTLYANSYLPVHNTRTIESNKDDDEKQMNQKLELFEKKVESLIQEMKATIHPDLESLKSQIVEFKSTLGSSKNEIEHLGQCKEEKKIVYLVENKRPLNCYELFVMNNMCPKSGMYNIYPGREIFLF